MNAIEVKNLNKRFANFQLDDVSFVLPKGYIMGLVGANGAGKTTLIRILMGLYLRDSGEVAVLGRDPFRDARAIHEDVGFVFDTPKYYDFKLGKIIRIIHPFYVRWDDDVFRSNMERFKLNDQMKFKTLSRGMKLKFSLAIALSHDAGLLILDEPTSGLDPIFRLEFLDILQELIEDGSKSILFSSHITSDVEKIADYFTYIKEGRIVFSENRNQVLDSYLLVRGTSDEIPAAVTDVMIAGKLNTYNYEALIPSKHGLDKVWQIEETPTLEQIMYYYEKG